MFVLGWFSKVNEEGTLLNISHPPKRSPDGRPRLHNEEMMELIVLQVREGRSNNERKLGHKKRPWVVKQADEWILACLHCGSSLCNHSLHSPIAKNRNKTKRVNAKQRKVLPASHPPAWSNIFISKVLTCLDPRGIALAAPTTTAAHLSDAV